MRHGNPPMSRIKSVSNFLGLTQSTMGLLFMVVLVGMGERMAERFLPIYLLALGGGVISIGLLNGLDNFLSAVYAFPGGYVSERIGFKRSLLVFNFMAMAGYDPRVAPDFWKRMDARSGARPPEFLSTHPDPSNRVEQLNRLMPKAVEYYNQNSGK